MPIRNHIDLVEKTIRVLEALAESKDGTNLKTVASATGLVKSSVFRILYTLKELGYAEQDGFNGVYHVSPKILELSRRVVAASSLRDVARPHMVWLRDAVSESVWLAELRRRKVVLVEGVEAQHALHLRYRIGESCPLHATAVGKAIAAHLPPRELKGALGEGRLRCFTPYTIIRRSRLVGELARVRESGFAINNEETTEGAIIFGSPIFDAKEAVIGAICVTVPTVRCPPQRQKAIIGFLKKTGSAITADLRTLGFYHSKALAGGTRDAGAAD